MSGNLKQIFEYELHRKLSLRAKSTNSEMNLLISSFKFYDIDETGLITRENWNKVFNRIGLSGFSEYDFNELFDIFDPNKTGVINYKNFTQYIYDLSPYQPFQGNSNMSNMSNNFNMNNFNMKNNVFINNNNKVQYFNDNFNSRGKTIQNNINDNFQNPVPQITNDNQRFKPITPLDSNQNVPNYHNMNNNMNDMNLNNMNMNNNMNVNNMNMNNNMNVNNMDMNMNMNNMNMNNNMNVNNMDMNNNMNFKDPMMNQQNQIPMQSNIPPENDSEGMKRYFQNLLQLFQSKININNGVTFYNLLSKMNNKQDKISKTISYENFLSSIKEAKIDINEMDIKDFFTLIDLSEQNKVSTDEILRLIKGYLSERRKMIIVEKFAKMDSDRKGYCEINIIKNFFNPNQHPDVLMGKKRENEIYEEFIYTFDTFTSYKEKHNIITFDDFIEYYSGISASIYDEDYFVDMMNGVWDTPINYHNIERSNNFNMGNNINLQQEQNNQNNFNNQQNLIQNQNININNNNINNLNNNNFDIQFQSRRPQSFNPLNKNEPKYNIISGEFNENNNNNKLNNQYNNDQLNYNKNNYNENTQISTSQNDNLTLQNNNKELQNQNNQSIETLNKLRSMIISRGPKSLFVIEKMLSMYDNTHSGKIDFPTFEKIITLYRLSLTPNEIVTIFTFFDNTNSGKINYDDLIKALIDKLPLRREQLIRKIFNSISNGRNEISFQELKSNYNSSRDPEVVARKKIPEEVIGDFSDNLEIFREYNCNMSKSNNGYFCYDDFLKFYSQISFGISDNNYFEYLVNNVWNLDGGNANNFYNYGNNIFEQRARSAYNRF